MLCCKGQIRRNSPGQGNLCCCIVMLDVGEESERKQWCLLGFQSLPLLPTSKIGPSDADSQVVGLVYILGPCGSLQQTLLWGWELLPLPQPPQDFTARGFEALCLHTGTLGCMICLAPQLFLPVYLHANVGLSAAISPALSSSFHLVMHPPHPRFPSPPLLPVWINVSSLTLWLLDFPTVWFSGSSCYFFFKICCCPSFGCVRKQIVSTYASILAKQVTT